MQQFKSCCYADKYGDYGNRFWWAPRGIPLIFIKQIPGIPNGIVLARQERSFITWQNTVVVVVVCLLHPSWQQLLCSGGEKCIARIFCALCLEIVHSLPSMVCNFHVGDALRHGNLFLWQRRCIFCLFRFVRRFIYIACKLLQTFPTGNIICAHKFSFVSYWENLYFYILCMIVSFLIATEKQC